MSEDRKVLERIRAEIGRDPLLQFDGDTCVSLSLWDESEPFAGLIRHHDNAAKQRVLLDIARLRGLRTLDIHQNWLRSLPAELGELQELRSLNICSNYLGTLPEWIWGLGKLEFLSVGVNNLEAVSPRVGELQNLQALFLHKNRIRELPKEVLQLSGLKTLSLYLNAIPEFPGWVSELPDIEMFSWGISGITRFPREIAAWKKLKYLTLVMLPVRQPRRHRRVPLAAGNAFAQEQGQATAARLVADEAAATADAVPERAQRAARVDGRHGPACRC